MERNNSIILASSDPVKYEPDIIPESPETLSPILQERPYNYGTPENSGGNNEGISDSPDLYPRTPNELDSPDIYPGTPKEQIPFSYAARMSSVSPIVIEKTPVKTPRSILRIGNLGMETPPSARKSVKFRCSLTPVQLSPMCSPAYEDRPYINKLERHDTAFCLGKSSEQSNSIFHDDFTEDDFLSRSITKLSLNPTKSSSPSRTPLSENVGWSPTPSSPLLLSPAFVESSLKRTQSMPQLYRGKINEKVNHQKSTPQPQMASQLAMSPTPTSSSRSPSCNTRPARFAFTKDYLIPPWAKEKVAKEFGVSWSDIRRGKLGENSSTTIRSSTPKPHVLSSKRNAK